MNTMNLRSNSSKGHANYDVEWGFLHGNDCQFCKEKNECKTSCKHRNFCKLYVTRTDEGIVKMKSMCKNVKLPVRGTAGAAGHDLAAAQSAVLPAHGNCLAKTDLAMALHPDCYGRIAHPGLD